ncbi:MAG: PASTA domain-containing protein [Bacteroidetes bacterium]|nr:MAG: PASTA domain-containing protein [Bacteroidota bacterium]
MAGFAPDCAIFIMLRYFISREFFLTLLALVGLGGLLYVAVFFWFLPAYTRHGEGLLVPDVSEMAEQTALDVLEEAGLRPLIADSIYMEDLPPGVIIKQYPLPYSRVKPKRTVSLTVNKREPPMVPMPNLTEPSMSIYHATMKLQNWNLSPGKVTRVPDIAQDIVLEALYEGKKIEPGTRIPQGSKIDLVVANGSGYRVPIPDLRGATYEEALAILEAANLQLGAISFDPSAPEDVHGQVFDQRPRPGLGDSISQGQYIDLRIYGPEPTTNEGIIIEEVEDGGR